MRLARPLAVALTVVLAGFAVLELIAVAQGAASRGELGWDHGLYMRMTGHFLATGHLYYPVQYTDGWTNTGDVNMYPPLALYLFVPMSLLPDVLWWAIPIGAVAWALARHRPPWWVWPILAGVACLLPFSTMLVYGNSTMWTLALVAVGTHFAAASPLAAFKPTEFLYTLPNIRKREWWAGIGLLALVSLPLLPLWFDWREVMSLYSGATLTYSLNTLPMFAAVWLVARVS